MSENPLDQALLAAQERSWSLVNQCLQQLSITQTESNGTAEKQIFQLNTPDKLSHLEQILSLSLQVLEFGDFQTRWEIAKVFPKLGTIAIAPLIEILQDEEADWELRWFVARILGEFHHPNVVTALVNLLQTSDDPELASIAAEALTNLGTLAIEALKTLLENQDTRLLAVRSLSQIRNSETIPAFISLIDDPDVNVRVAAIAALSSFHDPQIIPILINALKDISASVRKEAVTALGMRLDLLKELDLVSILQPLLFDFNLEVCCATAIALGRLGTNEAINALFQVINSPQTPLPLQIDIVRALGWVGNQSALEYLHQILMVKLAQDSESLSICQEIITVLGRVEQADLKPIAASILVKILPIMESANLKQTLALGLGQLGETMAIDSLIGLLTDPDDGVRLHAIAALKNFPQIQLQLENLLTDQSLTPELKQGVVLALTELNL